MKVASLEIELFAGIARLQNDMNQATRTVDGAMQRITRSAELAMKVLGGLAGAFSVQAVYQSIRGITELASRYNELGIVMNTVGRNAGYSGSQLSETETALRRTGISALESRNAIANLVAANIDLSKATNLARLSQDAAVIGGINSSEAFARLTDGIQSAQTETLRTLGLNVNFQKSYEELAKSVGKKTDNLSELEKTQARVNAVMALAPTIAGAYEASMENAGKQARSAARYSEDLRVELGQAFQPAYEASVTAYTRALQFASENVESLKNVMIALSASTIPLVVAGITKLAVTAIPLLTTSMHALTLAMLRNPLTVIPTLAAMAIAAFVALEEKTETTRTTMEKFGEVWGQIYDDAKKVTETLTSEVAGLWQGVKDLTGDTSAKTWTDSLIVGLARVADVAALVVQSIGTVIYAFNAAIADAKVALAWIARPDAISKMVAPEQSAKLEQEYQDALKSREAELKRFNVSLDGLLTFQGNKYEQAAITAVNATRVTSEAVALVDLTIGKSTGGMNKSADAAKGAASAYATLISSIRSKIEENKLEIAIGDKASEADKLRIKVAQELASGKLKLNAAQKAGIDIGLKAMKASESELSISKMLVAAGKQKLDLSAEAVRSVYDEARQNEDLAATFGMSKSAIEFLTIARLEDQLAQKDALKLSQEEVKALELTIEARKRNAAALSGIEGRETDKRAWEEWAGDVKQIFGQVGQSLTDAIFEGGKSGREIVKDLFKTLTLRVLISPVMGAMEGAVKNGLGGMFGYRDPQQQGGGAGGMLNNASSLNSIFGAGYQAMTGASAGASTASLGYANAVGAFGGDSIGALISANGGWEGAMSGFGSAAGTAAAAGTVAGITSLGAGLGASLGTSIGTSAAAITSTTFSASLGAGAVAGGGAAGGALAGGLGAAMGAIGAAMPYVAAAVAIASALGVFGDGKPKTRHGQRSTSELADGAFNITQRDNRQSAGAAEAAQAMAEASVNAANDIFSKVGVNAAIDSFYAVMESSVLGDRQGVASGGTLRSGDSTSNFGIGKTSDMTFAGFGGWSSEEMLPRLATDIQLSILQAFQHKADELPKVMADMLTGVDIRGLGSEETAALIARFYGVVTEVESFRTALETLPFDSLKSLSFDAAAGLIAAAGGLENLNTGLSSYYQNFYSQEEQLALSAKNIESALSGVSLAMPDVTSGAAAAKDAFRSLFESLDPTTEAGAAAIATMLGVNESFAQLVTGLDALNNAVVAVGRSAEDINRERLGLEGQLLQLQGNTVELRRRELAALDESNRPLQEQIWALGDLTAARQRELEAIYAAWSAAEQAGGAAMAALTRSVNAGKSELQKAFDAIAESLNTSISASRTAISTLESMAGRLRSTLDAMSGQTDERASRTWAQAQISRARIAGVAPSGAEFEQALQIVAQPSAGLFATFEDYQLDFLKTAHDVKALSEITGDQLTIEQRTLKTLEDQLKTAQSQFEQEMAAYDLMIETAQKQLDVEMGIDTKLLTIPEALAGIAAAIAGLKLTAPASYMSQNPDVAAAYANGSIQGNSADDAAAKHYAVHGAGEGRDGAGLALSRELQYLVNNPDVAAAYASGAYGYGLTPEDAVKQHLEEFGRKEGRSFAKGGYYSGGIALVGEEGPELINFKNPGQVYTASQTRNLMGGGGGNGNGRLERLVEDLTKEVISLKSELSEIKTNTHETAQSNRQMTERPQPVVVTNVVHSITAIPGQ